MATTKKATTESTPVEQLAEKRAELLDKRRALRAGELPNPRVIRALRKDIARLLTALGQAPSGTDEAKTQGDKE